MNSAWPASFEILAPRGVGHMARRPGPVPHDIDVLVVGTADRDDLEDIARAAQDQLGRPVDIRRVRPAVWAAPNPDDAFLASVRQRPLVEIPIAEHEEDTP